MKYRFLVLGMILYGATSGNLLAQRPYFQPQVHEISLHAVAAQQVPDVSEYYENLPVALTYLNGLGYRYHLTYAHALRARVDYERSSFDIPDGIERFEQYAAEKSEWVLRLGYERKYHTGAIQWFAGIDGRLGMGSFESAGQLLVASPALVEDQMDFTSYGAAISGGARVFFSPYLSAGLEVSAHYAQLQYQEVDESVFYLQPDNDWGWKSQLFLSIHFQKMKKRCSCPRF